jgi:heme O synthase-like polyprenyltransferase
MKNIYFLSLVNLLVVLGWSSFSFSKILRLAIIFLVSLFYVFWGWEIAIKEKMDGKHNLWGLFSMALLALALVGFLLYYD